MFMVLLATFLFTCLKFDNLVVDKVTYYHDNTTGERDVLFSDLFDIDRLQKLVVCLYV